MLEKSCQYVLSRNATAATIVKTIQYVSFWQSGCIGTIVDTVGPVNRKPTTNIGRMKQ